MDIRVFVLANERAAPTNYQHVLVNPLKIDWLTRAMNYKEVISNAVDADMAGGRAFVTEYAGTSNTVLQTGIHSESVGRPGVRRARPVDAVNILNAQELAFCQERVRLHVEPPAGLRAAARVPAAAGRRRAAAVLCGPRELRGRHRRW
jgi:hypothetical protein